MNFITAFDYDTAKPDEIEKFENACDELATTAAIHGIKIGQLVPCVNTDQNNLVRDSIEAGVPIRFLNGDYSFTAIMYILEGTQMGLDLDLYAVKGVTIKDEELKAQFEKACSLLVTCDGCGRISTVKLNDSTIDIYKDVFLAQCRCGKLLLFNPSAAENIGVTTSKSARPKVVDLQQYKAYVENKLIDRAVL